MQAPLQHRLDQSPTLWCHGGVYHYLPSVYQPVVGHLTLGGVGGEGGGVGGGEKEHTVSYVNKQ